jgi:methylmalonyl-CoA mutase cobalamin-binding domain/chain
LKLKSHFAGSGAIKMASTSEITSALENLEYKKIRDLVKKALESGAASDDVLNAMQAGMNSVGDKYESGEYFLSELMAASEMMKEGLEELTPHLNPQKMGGAGTVIIGTARGDLHDIGKNLVKTLLQTSGFTVYDLGLDVSPETFVNKVKESNADILAISALLTTSMPEMKTVVEELEKSGIRDKVKVIVGGNSVTEEFGREIRADGATKNAMIGVRICRDWVKK